MFSKKTVTKFDDEGTPFLDEDGSLVKRGDVKSKRIKLTFQVLFYLLLTLNVCGFITLKLHYWDWSWWNPQTPSDKFFPEFQFQQKLPDFNREEAQKTQQGYRALLVENGENIGLPAGWPKTQKTGLDGEEYGVAVLHQMHCLVLLRRNLNYLRATSGHISDEWRNHSDMLPDDIGNIAAGHIDHFVDFIYQSVRCSADLTLLPASVENGKLANDLDAYGGEYKCRNWDAVTKFFLQHSADPWHQDG
ncbi:hypothetical protein NA57DRAFT_78554 [Rhizodiscina lignyota]|uniref:Cyclochlorotine biosynthesis protein O n=1 Tax=Rhizodiscina lignyota TaxID=1504668 RepID=A0A9P4M2K3_9PEZI|nr:hypothetical protein NA57DRAFT_78554 [Rhizodiscina lignyota]